MQAYAVHFAVRHDQKVTQSGSGNHCVDRFFKFSLKQTPAARCKDLAFLIVVDVDLITGYINVCILHCEIDTSGVFSPLIIEIEPVLRVAFRVRRKNTDKAVPAENTQNIVRELHVSAAGRPEYSRPEAEQLLIGNADAGGIVKIMQEGNHLIDKVGVLDQVVVRLLSGAAEIIKRNIGFHSGIGHGYAGQAECLPVRRYCRRKLVRIR